MQLKGLALLSIWGVMMGLLSPLYGQLDTSKKALGQPKKAFLLSDSQEWARLFHLSCDTMLIDQGYFQGLSRLECTPVLVWPDGMQTQLSRNERIVQVNSQFVYTIQANWKNYAQELRAYQRAGNQLEFFAGKELSMEQTIFPLHSGRLLVSDFYELAGRGVQLYDEQLNLTYQLQPFVGEFQHFTFSEQGDSLLLIFQERISSQTSTSILIDQAKGKKVVEKIVSHPRLLLPQSKLLKEHFTLFAPNTLTLQSLVNERSWELSLASPIHDIFLLEGQLICLTSDSIIGRELATGKRQWAKSYQNDYARRLESQWLPQMDKQGVRLLATGVNPANHIILILGQANQGKRLPESSKYGIALFEYTFGGNLETVVPISPETHFLQIEFKFGMPFLITDETEYINPQDHD